jgi:DNA-binding transcriptional MerR regulator
MFDYKEWYGKNKERVAEARRRRYETDPAYREKIHDRNLKVRTTKKRADLQVKREEDKAKKAEAETPWREVVVNGQTYLTIGALARVLGKSVKTLRLWETQGLIPKAQHRAARGDRLYTPEEVLDLREKLLAEGKIEDVVPAARAMGSVHGVLVRGVPVRLMLFRISVLAEAAGRSVATFLQLEDKGRFPKTPLRSVGGQRLYTREMIEAVAKAVRQMDASCGRDWAKFYRQIHAEWERVGLFEMQMGGGHAGKTSVSGREHDNSSERAGEEQGGRAGDS